MDATNLTSTNRHWTDRDTLTVTEAAGILSLGRSSAYDAARRGEIPTIKLGSRLVVPVPLLKELLGYNAQSA